MNHRFRCAVGLLGILLLAPGCVKPADHTSRGSPVEIRHGGDPNVEVVVRFYRALLQEQPVSRAQEEALFVDEGGIRGFLIDVGEKKDDPIVLRRFRQYKDLFVPRNPRRAVPNISIVSLQKTARQLDQPNNAVTVRTDTVLATMMTDETATRTQVRERQVSFRIFDGKIDPDAIEIIEGDSLLASDWIRETIETPDGVIREAKGTSLAPSQEHINDLWLTYLRPTMSREQVEKWMGPPFKTAGVEENGILFSFYYVQGSKPVERRLMSVEYDRRDGKWMFVRTGGPHGAVPSAAR